MDFNQNPEWVKSRGLTHEWKLKRFPYFSRYIKITFDPSFDPCIGSYKVSETNTYFKKPHFHTLINAQNYSMARLIAYVGSIISSLDKSLLDHDICNYEYLMDGIWRDVNKYEGKSNEVYRYDDPLKLYLRHYKRLLKLIPSLTESIDRSIASIPDGPTGWYRESKSMLNRLNTLL